MRVEARIDRLRALHAGEIQAEPYIWPLFFRVDSRVFGDVLRDRLQNDKTTPEDLQARGISADALPDATAPASDSFHAPGGEHGNLPPMQTGQSVDVGLAWSTSLEDGDSLLLDGHSLIGVAVVLWEEDLMPGAAAVRKEYAEWARVMRGRITNAVARTVTRSKPVPGPFLFDYRDARESGRVDARFDPIELEAELTQKMPKVHGGLLIDRDDFIGAMVWCVSRHELAADGVSFTKLWTPTTGSEEGSWELDVSVGLVG